MKDYFVYILECNDGSYYTGVTSELEKRVNEHNSGFHKGYTPSRLPIKLVYSNRFTHVNEAINTEKQIKGWSRAKKEALIIGDFDFLRKLSRGKNENGFK
jgi:putative endonuclease